eukprot:5202329-Pleurochrysis_carterae.AAC.1
MQMNLSDGTHSASGSSANSRQVSPRYQYFSRFSCMKTGESQSPAPRSAPGMALAGCAAGQTGGC